MPMVLNIEEIKANVIARHKACDAMWNARRAKIERRIEAGEDLTAIATSFGVSRTYLLLRLRRWRAAGNA